MTNTTKLQAHDKAFANMHQLSIEMATTRLKIESKLSDPLNMEQLESLLEGQSGMAVGVINNQITFTSFEKAIYEKKDINENLWVMNNILTR